MAIQGTEFVRFCDLKAILMHFVKSYNNDAVYINSDNEVFINSNSGVSINDQPIAVASNRDFKEYLGIQ